MTTQAAITAVMRPGSSVLRALPSSSGRRATMATAAAVSGSRSGLTAMAPTMRMELRSSTPKAAMTPATAM